MMFVIKEFLEVNVNSSRSRMCRGDSNALTTGLPMTSYIILAAVVSFVFRLWITGTTGRRKIFKRSGPKTLPGPLGIPFVGNMLSLSGTTPHISLMHLARRFGNIFRIRLGSRPVLVLNGYDAIYSALVKHSRAFAGRPSLFTFDLLHSLSPGRASLSFSSYDERWKLHRKLAESSLRHFTAGSQVKFVESVVTTEASELMNHIVSARDENNNVAADISATTSDGNEYDFRSVLRLAVSNIMFWLMFSKRHSYDDQKLLHFLRISDRFSAATGSGNPVDFMPWLRVFSTKTTSDFVNLLNEFRTILGGELELHQEQYTVGSERDIIDHLVTVARRYGDVNLKKVGLNEHILLETCHDYFGAGFETISSMLEWAFLYMVAHPDIQTLIQSEIDDVVGRDRLPTLDDRTRLPFTHACILEIQRHSSVLSFTIPHSTTEDVILDDYFVPKDTLVFVNLYSAHFDPEFWHEPQTFNPRRFLAADGTIDQEKKSHVIAFGLGRRRCVGSDLARSELFLFFSLFLQRFSFRKNAPGKVNMSSHHGLVRRPKELNLKLLPRR